MYIMIHALKSYCLFMLKSNSTEMEASPEACPFSIHTAKCKCFLACK